MGLVVLRGAIRGELASGVAIEAIVAMLVFMCLGSLAGWIMDQLVQDSLRRMFQARVDWYRQGLIDAGYREQDSPAER
jgi:hypothetical protein